MEVRIIDTAEVCQGAVRPRTLMGVPTSAFIGLLVFTVLMVYLLGLTGEGLLVLVVGAVVYGWLRWQTKRDPYWIQTWWAHIQHPDIYEA